MMSRRSSITVWPKSRATARTGVVIATWSASGEQTLDNRREAGEHLRLQVIAGSERYRRGRRTAYDLNRPRQRFNEPVFLDAVTEIPLALGLAIPAARTRGHHLDDQIRGSTNTIAD